MILSTGSGPGGRRFKSFRPLTLTAIAPDSTLGSPDFEALVGVSQSQAEKRGKPLAAIDHLAATADDQIKQRLESFVRAAYSFDNGVDRSF